MERSLVGEAMYKAKDCILRNYEHFLGKVLTKLQMKSGDY